MFAVYKHHNNKGQCFYIGLSKYCSKRKRYERAFDLWHRSKKWQEFKGSGNVTVDIVCEFNTREEAEKKEHEEIIKEKLINKNLANILNGEVGLSYAYDSENRKYFRTRAGKIGYWRGKKRDAETLRKLFLASHTKEAIEKRSNTMRGRKLSMEHRLNISKGNIGKKHKPFSDKTRLKMSLSHKGKIGNKHAEVSKEKMRVKALGRILSEETKLKIGLAHKGKITSKAKKIICIETKEIFRCASEASKIKGGNVKHIQACCAGRRNSCGGFKWKYL